MLTLIQSLSDMGKYSRTTVHPSVIITLPQFSVVFDYSFKHSKLYLAALHYKNGRGALTRVGLSQLQLHYQKNVNTSKSITLLVHYRSPLQFQTCNG